MILRWQMLIKNIANKNKNLNNKQFYIMIKTAPPKESIGGTKPHHAVALENALSTYDYANKLQTFRDTLEFDICPTEEKEDIDAELLVLEQLNAIQVRKVERY